MIISHIYPPTDDLMSLWTKHSKHKFMDQECDQSCDLIYCGSVTQLERAYALSVKHRKPIVCWVWDLPANWRMWGEFEQNLHRDPDMFTKLNLLMKCKSIVSASKYTQSVLDMFGLKSEQMYFYVDIDYMKEVPIKPKKDRIIQVSRYAVNKRFELTIDMWERLQDKYPNWELMFIGFGKDRAEALKERGKNLKNFTVLVDQPRFTTLRMIQESKVLVSPSVFEGWGITPYEGVFYGCHPVMADIPVVQECWPCERLFDTDDIDSYISLVEYTMLNTGLERGYNDSIVSSMHPKSFAERMDKHLNKVFNK